MRRYLAALCLVFACKEEPPPEPPPAPKPATPGLSLRPSPQKLRSFIKQMNKEVATQEEFAMAEYASDPKIRPDVLNELYAATKDPDKFIRSHAARALGLIAEQIPLHEEKMVEVLLPLLDDPDPWVPVSAADALGQTKLASAVPPLLARLDDKENVERAEACRQALVTLTGQDFKKPSEWRKWWEKNKDSFTPASAPAEKPAAPPAPK